MKIKQFVLNKDDVIKGLNFGPDGENLDVFRLRVKAPYNNFKSGLFINNNPYLIKPLYNDKNFWEIDTKGNLLINSIKFDFKTKDSLDRNVNKI